MDHDALCEDLETSTLTDEEMDANWNTFEDRFPTFTTDAEDSDDQSDADTGQEVGLAD